MSARMTPEATRLLQEGATATTADQDWGRTRLGIVTNNIVVGGNIPLRNPRAYGPSTLLAGNGGASSGTAFAQEDSILTVGVLSKVSARIYSVAGSPTLRITVIRPGVGTNAFTVVASATVTVTAVGIATYTAADFGVINLASGDKLALQPINCTLAYNSTVSPAYKYWSYSNPTISVEYTWAKSGSNLDLQFSFEMDQLYPGVEALEVGPVLTASLAATAATATAANTVSAALLNNDSAIYGEDPILTTGSAAQVNPTMQNDGLNSLAGNLSTFKINIAAVGSTPQLTIWIMRPNAAKTQWTPIASATVAVPGVGTVTYTDADFGVLPLVAGDKVGFSTTTGTTIRYQTTGAAYAYWYFAVSSPTIGTPYATTLTGGLADWQVQYTIKNKTVGVMESQLATALAAKIATAPVALARHNAALGSTNLTATSFTSTTPAGWTTAGSGWSNTTDGLLSPTMAGIDYAFRCSRAGEVYNTNRLKQVWTYIPQATGSRAGFGFISTLGVTNGTMIQVDDVNHLLKIHGNFATPSGTSELTIVSSTAIASLTAGREYKVSIERNFGVITGKLTDMVTGTVLATITNGSNAVLQFGWPAGNCQDTPCVWPMLGQILVTRHALTCPVVDPLVVFSGDSTTMGTGALPAESWANILTETLGGRAVNVGQTGASFSKIAPELTSLLDKFTRIGWYVMNLGFNSPSDVSGMATAVAAAKTYCDGRGIQLAVMVQWPNSLDSSMSTMIAAQMALRGVRLIRGDRAMTLNGDGSTAVAGMYYDGVHLSKAGNEALAARVLLDIPELLYS